jgi:hypothetical protein
LSNTLPACRLVFREQAESLHCVSGRWPELQHDRCEDYSR